MNPVNKAHFFKVFAMAFKVAPQYIVLLIVNAVFSAGQILANVILPRYLIDEIALGAAMDVNNLFIFGGAIVVSNLFFALAVKFFTWKINIAAESTVWKIQRLLSKKITSIEYHYLENPYYLDLKERAVFAMENQSALYQLVACIAAFAKSAITLAGLLVIMFQLSWILVVALLATIALMLVVQALFSRYQTNFYQKLIPINRKFGYYINLCYGSEIQKDSRLYGMSEMISDRIMAHGHDTYKWMKQMMTKQGMMTGLYQVIAAFQSALAYGYVGLRCVTDVLGPKISIGSMTMYVSSAVSFSTSIYELGRSAVTIDQMLRYLAPFEELMMLNDAKDEGGNIPLQDKVETIRFENVSFSYPKSDIVVLDNISFEIRRGQKISVVGLNGAGKTTIVKLLCRLFKPTSGKIYVNETDIQDYDYYGYLRAISAVFQDYKLFSFTIEENITCKSSGEDRETALATASKVGLEKKISKLPHGIESLLDKNLDKEGVEMSGGERQKVAIARALYKDASLVILDEPTSALDPLAEAEIYDEFNKLVGERTAIYISHRMSSSVFCDKILIIDGGKVADFDTHHNLMQKTDGLYYKLFTTQAENYKLTKYTVN